MKVIVVFILIAIGVFLFVRAQRLAREEQAAMMAKKTAENAVDMTTSPQAIEPKQGVDIPSKTDTSIDTKSHEAELMPRQAQTKLGRVEMAEDIIDVDVPAETNEQSVIILADASKETVKADEVTTPVSTQADILAPSAAVVKVESAASSAKVEVNRSSLADGAKQDSAKSVPQLVTSGPWANVTLQRAVEEYQGAETELTRYNALLNVIAECYKQRKSTEYVQYGAALATLFLELFHRASATKPKETELKTTGFLQLATLLNDTQAFDQAIELCKEAIALGLTDGTVTGFEGRISRIEKAQAKAATA